MHDRVVTKIKGDVCAPEMSEWGVGYPYVTDYLPRQTGVQLDNFLASGMTFSTQVVIVKASPLHCQTYLAGAGRGSSSSLS